MSARAQAGRQRTQALRQGRQADSARRRQRVITALEHASRHGAEISVSAIARAAGVDRSFLYRHHDLLAKTHVLQAAPAADGQPSGPGVTRVSLQADLAAAHERALRLTSRIRQLEHRLSGALGEQAWHESGLAAPADLANEISQLQQQVIDLRLQLEERDQDLAAARSANRELMAQLNHAMRCG
jgi:transposase-like protein